MSSLSPVSLLTFRLRDPVARELLVHALDDDRIEKRVDVSRLSPAAILAMAQRLQGQINTEEFYIEGTGVDRPVDDDTGDPDDVNGAVE